MTPGTTFMKTALTALALGVPLGLGSAAVAQQGNWDGPYGGVQLGYGDFDVDGTSVGDADGEMGGLFIGYNRDMGDYVFGAELSYDLMEANFNGGAGEIDEMARLKLRAGWDRGRSLIYVTGGPAWAEATIGNRSRDEWGWFVGGGVDYQVTDTWLVGGEILYTQIDDLGGNNVDVDGVTMMVRAGFRF